MKEINPYDHIKKKGEVSESDFIPGTAYLKGTLTEYVESVRALAENPIAMGHSYQVPHMQRLFDVDRDLDMIVPMLRQTGFGCICICTDPAGEHWQEYHEEFGYITLIDDYYEGLPMEYSESPCTPVHTAIEMSILNELLKYYSDIKHIRLYYL